MPRYNNFPKSFAFRLESHVAARLCKVAEAHGYKPAEWARKIISEEIEIDFERRAVRLRVLHADLLREYLREWNMQGNNMNQIARALNRREGGFNAVIGRELEAIRQQNQAIMAAVLDALGADEAP